ncbi:T9SS type A sorting domain-containing protein [Panacibacter ginsenosidivorans]|uniref:T9SS type A sorting domain-containing protein n=1 Tax=Panacibacter ginsenosidivorans TaxID=1813871 RepID=A0A5B8V8T0_9BACT|nr:T9SS type A sorting domain-containing protein [Panacibacter ginsenosidivorans]QEC66748.1 T9SS type A sorting domain-containing protein [Panacibacter ginsenosidivorans]
MKKTWQVKFIPLFLCTFLLVKTNAQSINPNGYGVWQAFGDVAFSNPSTHPDLLRGRLFNINWSQIMDPVTGNYDFTSMDQSIKVRTTDNGAIAALPIIVMVYVYNLPDNGPAYILADPSVSKIKVTYNTIPQTSYDMPYFDDADYKVYFKNMITALKNHIQDVLTTGNYSNNIKNAYKKIIGIQACLGSTGDYISYKGDVINYQAYDTNLRSLTCDDFTRLFKEFTKYYYQEYNALNQVITASPYSLSPIRVLINPDNSRNDNDAWIAGTGVNDCNCKDTWRKSSILGHIYQFNQEKNNPVNPDQCSFDQCLNGVPTSDWWYTTLNTFYPSSVFPPSGDYMRARCELSGELIGNTANWWYDGSVSGSLPNAQYRNLFALYAYMLHWGVDWSNATPTVLNDQNYWPAMDFFNKYSAPELKNPGTATKAFCMLRDGLDASDYVRFNNDPNPQITCLKDATNTALMNRFNYALNYVDPQFPTTATFIQRGADIRDMSAAIGGSSSNRKSTRINDVGWEIIPDNYSRYITQIKPRFDLDGDGISELLPLYKSCDGWWNLNYPFTKSDGSTIVSVYGRFAKSITNVYGKRAMYFDINNSFLSGYTGNIKITITYLDKGSNKFYLKYKDASGAIVIENIQKSNAASPTWKQYVSQVIPASYFVNSCAFASDFFIQTQYTGGVTPEEDIVALVEVEKVAGPMKQTLTNKTTNSLLSVYPNPASDRFTVSLQNKKIMSNISIIDQSGRVVYQKQANNVSVTILRSEIGNRPGIYFISVTANGVVYKKELKLL